MLYSGIVNLKKYIHFFRNNLNKYLNLIKTLKQGKPFMKDEWFISEYQLLAESNCTKLYIKFKLTI